MAHLSLEDTLKKENKSIDGALLKISQALQGLVSSLGAFREVETFLGLESTGDYCGENDASPNFLGVVAGTLKEMVGTLVSDVEAKPEIQKLLLVFQKSVSGAASEGAAIAKQGSSSVVRSLTSREDEAVGTSSMHSRALRRAVGCRHSCGVHPEVMDPYLWGTLPEDLVQLALARLSIAEILDIYAQSAWSRLSRSPNFRQVCFERHPKVFGLVGRGASGVELRNVVYDIKSNKWIKRELVHFHRNFGIKASDRRKYMSNSKYACHGGLVCFVPEMRMLTTSAIRIGNPLTDDWKPLPCLLSLPGEKWKMIMVQLATEEGSYKVILVFGDEIKKEYAAECYDSRTGGWSSLDSGLVYGNGYSSFVHNQVDDPRVFDCATRTMYQLVSRSYPKTVKTAETMYRFDDRSAPHRQAQGVNAHRCAIVTDRLLVLHESRSSEPHDPIEFRNPLWANWARQSRVRLQVSEYAWQSSTSELRIISRSAAEEISFYHNGYFFASGGSIFLLVDSHSLGMKGWLYDASANDWHRLSNMGEAFKSDLKDYFWCELRWNVVP